MVCPSGILPPDIPQIWNGRFCTLIRLPTKILGTVPSIYSMYVLSIVLLVYLSIDVISA